MPKLNYLKKKESIFLKNLSFLSEFYLILEFLSVGLDFEMILIIVFKTYLYFLYNCFKEIKADVINKLNFLKMKKIVLSMITILTIGFYAVAQDLSPYFKVGESTETIDVLSGKIVSVLEKNGFTILGNYNPSEKATLKIVAFTRTDIKEKVVKVKDRGALAAVFKIGLEKSAGKVIISYTNPEYLLRAYLMNNYELYRNTFIKFSEDLKNTLLAFGDEFVPFGGSVKADKLKKYHYKIMMPYFTDPIELATYDSFEQGLIKIQNNLSINKGATKMVYKLVYKEEKVAVFGIALKSKEEGEAYFLPKIGESNIAAMPYEIILQDNVVTMLHGKYRIALFWPDLSMGTFMKIMSTPGDIKDALKAVCN